MRGIFDTHAHYDDRAFDEDREEILAQLKEQGYSGIVDIGASFESCKKAVEISNTHDIVYATVGIHPDCIEDFFEGENNRNTSGNRVIEEMYNMIKNNKKVVAVGEIGLDYHNMTCEKDLQEIWFRAQLDMAKGIINACSYPLQRSGERHRSYPERIFRKASSKYYALLFIFKGECKGIR